MNIRDTIRDTYEILYAHFGPQHWWPAESAYEMMVGAVLTQNTAWRNVERAIAALGDRLTPEYILSCSEEELIVLIRPAGFYRQKAARLKTLTQWYSRYGCERLNIMKLPPQRVRRELLALNGIGRETADSIMLYAFEIPIFEIDAYTMRLFTRLGLSLPKKYDGVQSMISSRLPRDSSLFNEYHALIVAQCKTFCRKSPLCGGCPLKKHCFEANGLDKNPVMR